MDRSIRGWLWLASCLPAMLGAYWSVSPGWEVADPRLTPDGRLDFDRDIRPILARSCWPCHKEGQPQLEATGNLRLDTFEGATGDRGGYQALSPGKPEESAIWLRINPELPQLRMPPPSFPVEPLSDREKELIRRWIESGGRFEQHWAYIPPKQPPLPKVIDVSWVRNGIDRFVLSQIEKQGFRPEPEADKATLLRRASLTLTGLPPTLEELDAFLADTRPDAYDRAVDRLLASPRYGVHQARYWLDAVRYADTHGLHIDNEREVFPYRDWVVRAFNQDLRFDQMTLWQLAGDLLPSPTTEQRIASGYIRMHPTTTEGGVIEEEFLVKNTFDRVDTTATVWLGMTMACSKCHDHKYDPISIRDYYRMFAFFNSTAEAPLDGNLKLHEPTMKAPTPEQEKALSALDTKLRQAERAVPLPEAVGWLASEYRALPTVGAWEVLGPFASPSFDEAFATEFGPENATAPPGQTWRKLEVKESTATAVVGRENAAAYLRSTLEVAEDTEFTLQLGSDDALKVWVNGKLIHDNKVLRSLTPDQDKVALQLRKGANAILVKIVNAGGPDAFSVTFGSPELKRIASVRERLNAPSPTPEDYRRAQALYLELGPESSLASGYRATLNERTALFQAIPLTYIAKELPTPRPAYVLKRGEYNLKAEQVERGIPTVLGELPEAFPKDRLGLARWLVSRSNPLAARVTVNRVWQQHFGAGIVRSPEDFGSRGEFPTHPELLDFLAVQFMDRGWSLKELHRLIVTSATFRQSSAVDSAQRRADPENRWLARGPRFRLDAEVIRDQALYLSGLLVERQGGRGDKTYQPSGIWEAISYPISDTAKYVQDRGEALYRRSLYLFWKRTSPPATLLLFDAPMREACAVQRSRTNTPLQALAVMNDPQFFEAARVMAERVLKTGLPDDQRARLAFRAATSRTPTSAEERLILEALRQQRDIYRPRPDQAAQALLVGESPRDAALDPAEHLAWTMVCSLILNLDETLTQH
ncbi:MAG: DUF1553 domain-containing protein [Chthonomonadaceae bacterium]|nr:MAG: DUF1553 domain-containing protein [Chthonomonadaceae bacterium]